MSVTRLNQQRVDFYVGVLDDILQLVERIENCGNNRVIRDTAIPVVAKVEMTGFNVQIGMEYFIYINTYGIPPDGVFDETLLQRIRDGLPMPPTSVCGGCKKVVCCCKPVVCETPTDVSGCSGTNDPSGCSSGDCHSDSDSDSECGSSSACHTCHYVVCCCSSGCGGGCGDTGATGDTTGDTTNGAPRVDNDTAGEGDLGIVILE